MSLIVEKDFKVNFYLDTNILVDYVQQGNQNLVDSLNYLAQSPFVNLRSSHYVEFEFAEVRKKNEFIKIVTGNYPLKGQTFHHLSHKWKCNGVDFNDKKDLVYKRVSQDIERINNELNINFDDHVLHEKLISPTRELYLNTKISREDSMVMVSCMYPKVDDMLDFSVIFSNDRQYMNAFKSNYVLINSIFNDMGLNLPAFLSAKELPKPDSKLYDINSSQKVDIKSLWDNIILSMIKQKHIDNYLGHTIKANQEFIYVDIENPERTLEDSLELVLISKDLSCYQTIEKNFDFYNNAGKVVLPHKDPKDTKYSFKPELEAAILSVFQKKGNYFFYRDKNTEERLNFTL